MKIKALGYIGIASTNPSEWTTFLENTVGLMSAPMMEGKKDLYFKMDDYAWRICVFESDKNRLAYAGWEVATREDFVEALAELKAQNISFTPLSDDECKEKNIREGIRLHDPHGNPLEIFYNMQLDYLALNTPANVKGFETGYRGDMGLGHYVLPTNKFDECYEFYTQVLGFGLTDYMEFNFTEQPQGLHFLHVNNPRHHSLAIYQDPNPPEHNCIHLMFEVESIDEVGHFMDRCKENDIKITSSLGRHTNDLMMSVYVASPAGFSIEFGCDGVQLDWEDYTPTESARPSLWGHDWQA